MSSVWSSFDKQMQVRVQAAADQSSKFKARNSQIVIKNYKLNIQVLPAKTGNNISEMKSKKLT